MPSIQRTACAHLPCSGPLLPCANLFSDIWRLRLAPRVVPHCPRLRGHAFQAYFRDLIVVSYYLAVGIALARSPCAMSATVPDRDVCRHVLFYFLLAWHGWGLICLLYPSLFVQYLRPFLPGLPHPRRFKCHIFFYWHYLAAHIHASPPFCSPSCFSPRSYKALAYMRCTPRL